MSSSTSSSLGLSCSSGSLAPTSSGNDGRVEGGRAGGDPQAGERDAQAALFLDAFNYVWLIGLAAFGIHLALLGILVFRSVSVPRVLGWLLVVAGAAYVVDTLAHALLASYDDYETVFLVLVVVPSVVGELALALWLLLRGGREPLRGADLEPRPAASL